MKDRLAASQDRAEVMDGAYPGGTARVHLHGEDRRHFALVDGGRIASREHDAYG